jgi:hypothetical protein
MMAKIGTPLVTRTTRTKIRFTAPQLAFVKEVHPHCRFDDLAEVTFEFDRAGNVSDCTAKTDRNPPERDYTVAGLTTLYAIARKRFAARAPGSATILQFPQQRAPRRCVSNSPSNRVGSTKGNDRR